MRRQLLNDDPEVICCPEAYDTLFAEGWHGAFSRPDYGYYPLVKGKRKVALWSRQPWVRCDDLGSAELPPGRFVSAYTMTSIGTLHVVGVCVPWFRAHVSGGARNRRPWEDHVAYLRILRGILSEALDGTPTVVIGDFNQRFPRRYAPQYAFSELLTAIRGFQVWSQGAVPGLSSAPVCHVAGSPELQCDQISGYERTQPDGRTLSDHDGLLLQLSKRQRGT